MISVVLVLLVAAGAAHAGYLSHPPLHVPVHAPVVSYGYHTAVVTKPLLPAPHYPHYPLHYPHYPLHYPHYPPPPPPIIIKPIATSYQSFHKVDRPVYPLHYVKPLPLPLHAPLPLAYGHHYPHYLH